MLKSRGEAEAAGGTRPSRGKEALDSVGGGAGRGTGGDEREVRAGTKFYQEYESW